MPIYEYRVMEPDPGCARCRISLEALQKLGEKPLQRCPACGSRVKKIISRCRAVVVDASEEATRTVNRIRDYERSGMWSHAAELADTYAEKTQDADLRARAKDDYRKAGHDVDTLTRE